MAEHGNEKKGHDDKKSSGSMILIAGIILSLLITITNYLVIPEVEKDPDKRLNALIEERAKVDAMPPLKFAAFRAYNFIFGARYDVKSLLWYGRELKSGQGPFERSAIDVMAFFSKWILIFLVLFLVWESIRGLWTLAKWLHGHHIYKKLWFWVVLVGASVLIWGLGFSWAGWPTINSKVWPAVNHAWVWWSLAGAVAAWVAWKLRKKIWPKIKAPFVHRLFWPIIFVILVAVFIWQFPPVWDLVKKIFGEQITWIIVGLVISILLIWRFRVRIWSWMIDPLHPERLRLIKILGVVIVVAIVFWQLHPSIKAGAKWVASHGAFWFTLLAVAVALVIHYRVRISAWLTAHWPVQWTWVQAHRWWFIGGAAAMFLIWFLFL